MRGLDPAIIALVAVMAITTGEGTPFLTGQTALAVPTHCPAVDPMDSTVHLRHEVMCSLFYKCLAGDKILQLCAMENARSGELLFFNPELQVCDWRRNVSCTYPACSLDHDSSGYPIKIPFGSDCRHYYDCADGRLTIRECQEHGQFDAYRRTCVPKGTANCGMITDKCDTVYKEPLQDSCSFYVQCYNGRKTVVPCPAGKFFSRSRQDCVNQADSDCGTGGTSCSGTAKVPHPSDCNLYQQCVNGYIEIKQCDAGLHFNPFSQLCQDPRIAGCNRQPKPPPGKECIGDAAVPDLDNCSWYRQCVNGYIVFKECNTGLHFNPFSQICQDPRSAGCLKKPKPHPGDECVGDSSIPFPENCSWYKQCVNGHVIMKECKAGLHFNPFAHVCQNPKDAHCEKSDATLPPVVACSGNYMRAHETDCKGFYKCVNHLEHLEYCKAGLHFNPYAQACQEPKVARCEKPKCISNGKIPHDWSCSHYYQCVNGKGITTECPSGFHFSPTALTCMNPRDAGCELEPPVDRPTIAPGQPAVCPRGVTALVAHECRCDLYYSCENGKQIRKICPEGQHFDYVRKVCDVSYVVKCVRPIPDGITDDPPVNTPPVPTPTRGPEVVCPKTPGIIKYPHETKCSYFWRCANGKKTLGRCPKGLQYDIRDRLCNLADKVKCIDKPEYTKSEKKDATAVFKAAVAKTVENRLSPIDCPIDGSRDDRYFSHECFCNNYYGCQAGNFVVDRCPGNFHFDPEREACDLPHQSNCVDVISAPQPTAAVAAVTEDPISCIGTCPDEDDDMDVTIMLPNRDCSKFCMCSYGQPTVRTCPPGLHFFPEKQVCTWPREAKCKPRTAVAATTEDPITCIGTCPDEDDDMDVTLMLPNEDCSKYCMCSYGEATVRSCPAGLHFFPQKQVCTWPREAKCKPGNRHAIAKENSIWADIPFFGRYFL